MLRFYLRLTLIPIVLFTIVLMLIHAQPYDDHELREILLPEGCPAPCFMGIRPGVTSVDEALRLLENNKWVGEIYKQNLNYSAVTWTASLSAPDNMDRNQHNTLVFFRDKVSALALWASFRLGDIRIIFGPPDLEDLGMDDAGAIYYTAIYRDKEFALTVARPCQQSEITLWNTYIGDSYLRSLARSVNRDNRPPWREHISCVLLQTLKPDAVN